MIAMRTRWIVLVLTIAAVATVIVPNSRASGPQKPPNIVLIVLDDIGFEVLDFWPDLPVPFPPGVMGRPPTPALQSLAAGGIVFTNAWASPVCSPTRMEILTGRHAHRTGVGSIVQRNSNLAIDDNELFLPEVIKAGSNPHGYHTGAFGKWHLAPKETAGNPSICQLDHPVRNGFDVFKGHMWNIAISMTPPLTRHHYMWEKADTTVPNSCTGALPVVTEWSASVTRKDALAWIASVPPEDPFFAYIAFNAPHTPLQVPPFDPLDQVHPGDLLSPATVQYLLGLTNPLTGVDYVASDFPETSDARDCINDLSYPQHFGRHVDVFNWMVEAVDSEIGKIRRRLDVLGRLDDTVIVVVSDNGTSTASIDCPNNKEHAKGSIYQLGTRVPLIVWGPRVVGQGDEGSVCDELISAVDLWPTIAETAAVVDPGQYLAQQPEVYTLDGVSFSHLIAAPTTAASLRSRALIENFAGHKKHHDVVPIDFRRSVVDASGYKYVHQFWGDPPQGNDADEFHYLPSDQVELTNLANFGLPLLDRPTCVPFSCQGQIQQLGGLINVSCVDTPTCDLLNDMFDNFYAPLLCWCLATN